jgi:Fe-S-cluster containining protein
MPLDFNCKKCPNSKHCCIFKNNLGFTFIGIKDAKIIKSKIKKNYDFFLDYSPLSKRVVSYLKNDDPSLEGSLRYSELDIKNHILRLKTKKDGTCIFLNDKNMCDIYSIRPNICRIFPFWAMKLISGKIKVIPHDVEPVCKNITLIIEKDEDVEKILSKAEKNKIKKIFRNIIKETIYYKKNIKDFIKNIRLL